MQKIFTPFFFFLYLLPATYAQNVGVGTQMPDAKLHVKGAMKIDSFQNTHSPGTFLEWNKDNASGMSYLLNHKGNFPGGFIFGKVDSFNMITERMRIDENGNIGIGTIPEATLDVARGTAYNGTAVFRGTNHYSHFNYGPNEDTYIRGGKPNSSIIISDVLNSTVSIGSVDPVQKLNVGGNMNLNGNLGIGISTSISSQIGKLRIAGAPGEEGLDLSSYNQYANLRVIRNSLGTTDKDLYIGYGSGTTSSLRLYSDNVETMTIAGLKVGIGVSAPLNKLDVEGGVAIGSSYSGSTSAPTNGLIVEGNMGVGTSSPVNKMDVEGGMAVGATYAGTSAAPANGMIIEGKVGIGKNNPTTAKLVIGGTSTSEGLDLSSDNLYANMRVIRNSLSTLDKNLYLGFQSGANSSVRLYSNDTLTMVVSNTKVGMGTTTPKSKLDVEGGMSIGSSYSGSTAAPANGAIIQGNVGIGTNTPTDKLHIAGSLRIADGTQGNGKILTSDASGKGTWKSMTDIDFSSQIPPDLDCLMSLDVIPTNDTPSDMDLSGDKVYIVASVSNSLQVLDIADPNQVSVLGSATTGNSPEGVQVAGDYAYVVNRVGSSFQVFDVSDPAVPVLAATRTVGLNPVKLDISGNYAYVINSGSDNMTVIDITTPSNPSIVTTVNVGDNPRAITIAGNYAYIGHLTGVFWRVYDLTVPASPVYVTEISNTSVKDMAAQGDYLYQLSGANQLKIYSIATPANPTLIGSFGLIGLPGQIAVSGNFAYITLPNDDKMQIVNVRVPASPSNFGSIPTGDLPAGIAINELIAIVNNAESNSAEIFSLPCFKTAMFVDHSTGTTTFGNMGWNQVGDHITNVNTGNVGIGRVNPQAKLDVDGAIRSKYSGTWVSGTLQGNMIHTIDIPVPEMPAGWDLTNTLVLVSNADGGTSLMLQARVINTTTIQVKIQTQATGLLRLSYIIFKL